MRGTLEVTLINEKGVYDLTTSALKAKGQFDLIAFGRKRRICKETKI
jgi:hypothetical protein